MAVHHRTRTGQLMRDVFGQPALDADQQPPNERPTPAFAISGSERFVVIHITAEHVTIDAATVRALLQPHLAADEDAR